MSRVVSSALGVVAGTALTVGGLYWLFKHLFGDGKGEGFGLGLGGSGKGDKLFGKGGAGPAEEPGGTGGDEPEGSTDAGENRGGKGTQKSPGNGGTKATDRPGKGDKPKGTGKGDKKDGTGKGGSGGGVGGGEGGGVGTGEGPGMTGDTGEGGDVGEDDGGGEEPPDEYGGWGDLLITEDLDPPDISAKKIEQVRETIYTLVGDTVYQTELPPPLHEFHPELGHDIVYWADVALHLNYDVPWGRLDPDNDTHKPWIGLWLDILQAVINAENELNVEFEEEIDDPEWNASVVPETHGMARTARRHARGLWRAHVRRLHRRGEHPKTALARLLFPRREPKQRT